MCRILKRPAVPVLVSATGMRHIADICYDSQGQRRSIHVGLLLVGLRPTVTAKHAATKPGEGRTIIAAGGVQQLWHHPSIEAPRLMRRR